MRVLVTGGAGYIGAHVVRLLVERGDEVVVVDDLSGGDRSRIGEVPLVDIDLAGSGAVEAVADALTTHGIEAVIHFAARKRVGESVERAAWYYAQNVGALADLLQAMERAGTARLVFSSSAAVYATADGVVAEDALTAPVSPYGETKLAGEWLVASATRAFPLAATSLRYFNVAGAASRDLADGAALNLVPMAIDRLEAGGRPLVFGSDYPTADGTAVRDYIHVQDVAEAHLAALDALEGRAAGHRVYNVGTGEGTSVLGILDGLARVSGLDVAPELQPRRPGDPASVVASVDRIRDELGWSARFGLDDILRSAWESRGSRASA